MFRSISRALHDLFSTKVQSSNQSPPAAPGSAIDLSLSAEHFHLQAMAARAAGNDDLAFSKFAYANSLIPRFDPTRTELMKMSREAIILAGSAQDGFARIAALVRAIEMDPWNADARATLEATLSDRAGEPDLTKICFIFHDVERVRAIHGEAYLRALEFVTIGGVVGDVMEFGVLGGWSARIFAETMRDIFNLNRLQLFDSFEGLPEYDSEIDRRSFEIGGRNIWGNKMKFPDAFLEQFGQPHHLHIRDRLAEVIRAERIIVHKGFFSETLGSPIDAKAAIVHFDCDLYQSTLDVFEGLNRAGAWQDGSVLLFDDWNCNRANPNYGQRRALRDFLAGAPRLSASPWFTYGYNGAAYILHDLRA